MPTLTLDYTTEAERLELERALAYFAEMRRLAATATHGTVLATCERFALEAGRKLLRDNRETTAQAHADAQKKLPARGPKGDTPAT